MPWKLPDSDGELLRLAKGYPYSVPSGSYLFVSGEARPLAAGQRDGKLFHDRVPVIAHGSNRAPEQLARKFGNGSEIPVSRARLHDYDVVYSAHMSRYGAIAATLQHAPGVEVEVFVTWLTGVQLIRMHDTELGAEIYGYGEMRGIRLALDAGPAERIEQAGIYLSGHGCLSFGGGPIGLAAVPASGRRTRSLEQAEALALVQARLRPAVSIDSMILSAIRQPDFRHGLIGDMRAQAAPPQAPHFQPLDP